MRIGSARPSSALLGAREPVDKTDAGPSRHHELLLRARVSASPVRSANLVAPGTAAAQPNRAAWACPWRPGRRPWDHRTSRSEGYGDVPAPGHPAPGVRRAALPRDGHADAPPGEGLSPVRQRRARALGRDSCSTTGTSLRQRGGQQRRRQRRPHRWQDARRGLRRELPRRAGHRAGSGRQGEAEGGDGHNDPFFDPQDMWLRA
jgi:hypothetical protein